jgi:hypothetical protein
MSTETRTALIQSINVLIDELDLTDPDQLTMSIRYNNLIHNLNKYF